MQLNILLQRPHWRLQRLRKPFPSLKNNFSRNKVAWFLLLFGDGENWCQPWCDWCGRVTSPLMEGGSGNWVNVAVTSKLAPSSEKRKEWSSDKNGFLNQFLGRGRLPNISRQNPWLWWYVHLFVHALSNLKFWSESPQKFQPSNTVEIGFNLSGDHFLCIFDWKLPGPEHEMVNHIDINPLSKSVQTLWSS